MLLITEIVFHRLLSAVFHCTGTHSHLTSEQNLIHWLSNVHLGKRFADLIILDGLEKYVKFLGPSDWSGVLRLTSLLEETRMYVHRVTRADEHGHDCRLIIGCGLPRSLPSLVDDLKPNRLPPHNLRGTYVINPQGSPQRFRLSSLENQWALEIESKHGEWFWSTLALARDQSRLSATEWSVNETISELGV
ncbi:hypothetical protein FGIG_11062 [Fasciola gigantica]|uniref:Uncharacterized protein n=1 Tax=Fasciola gigantica TaxID=46835 RepID=A0A504YHQ2_FASGI|nr:hypothetical protein FGIG_11062 [Fasciola gigantica]